MITGYSKIENMDDLKDILASEILELNFALNDRQEGDELDEAWFEAIETKINAYELLLKRL